MESYQKRKRLLEETFGKLTAVKSFNDEVVNNNSERYVKQIADITYEEGLKQAYESKLAYINITINCLSQVPEISQSITSIISNYRLMIL